MTLAPSNLLACIVLVGIVAPGPPFSVVFTDWLSMIAALGAASCPSASRTLGRSAASTLSQVPSLRHLFSVNYFCRRIASPENVTEILALISHSNQDQIHLLARFRCRFIRRGVEQSLGHDATPVLHSALQRSQLSIFEPARIGLA